MSDSERKWTLITGITGIKIVLSHHHPHPLEKTGRMDGQSKERAVKAIHTTDHIQTTHCRYLWAFKKEKE
jgi:hypothetical protein